VADLKISQLTALLGAAAADTDVVPVVDISATATKKITLSELVEYIVASGVFSGAVSSLSPTPDFSDADNILATQCFSRERFNHLLGDNKWQLSLKRFFQVAQTAKPSRLLRLLRLAHSFTRVRLQQQPLTRFGFTQ
jgi:hypothetical protein